MRGVSVTGFVFSKFKDAMKGGIPEHFDVFRSTMGKRLSHDTRVTCPKLEVEKIPTSQ